MLRASCAAVHTNPSSVALGATGFVRFQSLWLSFQDGLGFSTHCVIRWYEATSGLPLSILQSLGGKGFEVVGSHPGLVGTCPAGELNCGNPSNCVSEYPLAAQYSCIFPK